MTYRFKSFALNIVYFLLLLKCVNSDEICDKKCSAATIVATPRKFKAFKLSETVLAKPLSKLGLLLKTFLTSYYYLKPELKFGLCLSKYFIIQNPDIFPNVDIGAMTRNQLMGMMLKYARDFMLHPEEYMNMVYSRNMSANNTTLPNERIGTKIKLLTDDDYWNHNMALNNHYVADNNDGVEIITDDPVIDISGSQYNDLRTNVKYLKEFNLLKCTKKYFFLFVLRLLGKFIMSF